MRIQTSFHLPQSSCILHHMLYLDGMLTDFVMFLTCNIAREFAGAQNSRISHCVLTSITTISACIFRISHGVTYLLVFSIFRVQIRTKTSKRKAPLNEKKIPCNRRLHSATEGCIVRLGLSYNVRIVFSCQNAWKEKGERKLSPSRLDPPPPQQLPPPSGARFRLATSFPVTEYSPLKAWVGSSS